MVRWLSSSSRSGEEPSPASRARSSARSIIIEAVSRPSGIVAGVSSQTACIVPWRTIVGLPNGKVLPCCYARQPVGSLYEGTLEDIWNSDEIVALRAALGRGERPATCDECWELERAGAASPRMLANGGREQMEPGALARLVAEGPATGHRARRPPDTYILYVGNLCNLKCRSCGEETSSRIASDPVHRAWSSGYIGPQWHEDRLELARSRSRGATYDGLEPDGEGLRAAGAASIALAPADSRLVGLALRCASAAPCRLRVLAGGEEVAALTLRCAGEVEELDLDLDGPGDLRLLFAPAAPLQVAALELRRAPERRRLAIVPAGQAAWFRDVEAVVAMLARNPGDAMIFLLGGEPFLIDEVWRVIDELIARGLAGRLTLMLSTNGTIRRPDLARVAPAFRGVVLSVSIDGYGPMFEYLRHGARWDDLLATLAWLRTVPNVNLVALPTVQNYNVLDLVRLFGFLDAQRLPFSQQLLTRPERLSILNLPPPVRRAAAARLRDYLATACRPAQRRVVRTYVDVLERAGDAFDEKLFREFMLFTNDLDATRKQRLADVAPDLAELIHGSGVRWSDDRRYA